MNAPVAKDYSVQIKVRNNRLLTYMRAMGFQTASELARAADLSPSTVGLLLNLKTTGMTSKDDWRAVVLKVSAVLRCLPEDIIPPRHRHAALEQNATEIEMDAAHVGMIASLGNVAMLPDDDVKRAEALALIDRALARLTSREREVIRLRYLDGDKTCDEVGAELGLSGGRVNQIELKALKRLKRYDQDNLCWVAHPYKNPLLELIEDGDVA